LRAADGNWASRASSNRAVSGRSIPPARETSTVQPSSRRTRGASLCKGASHLEDVERQAWRLVAQPGEGGGPGVVAPDAAAEDPRGRLRVQPRQVQTSNLGTDQVRIRKPVVALGEHHGQLGVLRAVDQVEHDLAHLRRTSPPIVDEQDHRLAEAAQPLQQLVRRHGDARRRVRPACQRRRRGPRRHAGNAQSGADQQAQPAAKRPLERIDPRLWVVELLQRRADDPRQGLHDRLERALARTLGELARACDGPG
jgi:hypothetical protein